MFKKSPQRNYWLACLMIASLLFPALFPYSALAQDRKRKPVIVSFGQPNIWSLEQAHYLLARMHMTNLELQAKALTDGDLDPNATHASRITILKQLLEIGAQFDQGIGFQNQRIVETARFNDNRRRNLTTNRDRLRAESLKLDLEANELESERKTVSDPTSDRAIELDAQIAKKRANKRAIDNEIQFHDSEIQGLSAEPTGTPASPTPTSSPFDKNRLPSSALDTLTAEAFRNLLEPGKDPKLNATTMLDNTVQFQYEIIAKQLTLLRDEVGPGERLVFLELPQSVYTTPGSGDEKMAQTWWHVNGYTRTDPLIRWLLELYEVEWKWKKIQSVSAFKDVSGVLGNLKCTSEDRKRIENLVKEKLRTDELVDYGKMYHDFKCEHTSARERILRNLFREVSTDFDRVEQGGARDTSKLVDAIRDVIGFEAKAAADKTHASKFTNMPLTPKAGVKSRQAMYELREELLRKLGKPDPEIETRSTGGPLYSFEDGIEFVGLGPDGPRPTSKFNEIERRTVRTVDIIPRQSSLNVNDIQSTVKATGILAAFKFLFGFAGQVNFQRQKEQFEQFVHQELYASGFGKGNLDFGWTFGALPGTKRVAPGVRTTYAALVVPDDADSLVLSARGCYFPRKSYQPIDFEDTSHVDWADDDKFRRYNCNDQQTYIIPIPGGGNTSNFWVTSVNYQPVNNGEFVTVSVRGNNFSSQMGVLINGVPLYPTVGLAHPHLMPKRTVPEQENTATNGAPGNGGSGNGEATNGATKTPFPFDCGTTSNICGRYERVDPGQIVFTFKMPSGSAIGIPTITLVAPGKSVDLNSLPNLYVNGTRLGKNANGMDERISESEQRVLFMFGVQPLTEVQLVSGISTDRHVDVVIRGAGFDTTKDTIYVNGTKIDAANRTFKSTNLYEVRMPVTGEDMLNVTVVQDKRVVTKSVPNPLALRITNTTNLRYDPAANNGQGNLIVKVEGSGFSPRVTFGTITGAQGANIEFISGSEIFVTLNNPAPTIVLRLVDPLTGSQIRRSIQR